MKQKLSHSARKFIARQKALIRKTVSDVVKQKEAIQIVYDKFSNPKLQAPNPKQIPSPKS